MLAVMCHRTVPHPLHSGRRPYTLRSVPAIVACIYDVDGKCKACSPLSVSIFYKRPLIRQNAAAYITFTRLPQVFQLR
jgi:hypothetical protein